MDEKLEKGFDQMGKGPDFEGPKTKDIAGVGDSMVQVKAHTRSKSSTQPGHPAKKRQPSSMKFMD